MLEQFNVRVILDGLDELEDRCAMLELLHFVECILFALNLAMQIQRSNAVAIHQ
jgi:hypothetical protein